jgi:Ca-activated chloride channel family protein
MRCLYCGLLQDEPAGVKECARCGGEMEFEKSIPSSSAGSYLYVQMELDQIKAPAGRNIDRYLLVTLRTPAQVPPEQAAPTTSGRPPINFSPVLDVSGSMSGGKLEQAKEAVRQALRHLKEGDALSLVTFSDQARCVLEPSPVNAPIQKVVESALQEIQATGMTALDGGLALGIEKVLQMRRDTNLVLLLSDGQANVGETDLEKVGQRAQKARQQGLVISTLGVGADYNEALMAEIATQGGGRFYHIQTPAQISAYLTGELGEAANLAARGLCLELSLPQGAALVPLSAAYPAEQQGSRVRVTIGDIPCDTELEIPLRLTLFAQQPGARLSVEGSVTYQSPAGKALSAALNRVTVRFIEGQEFTLREGIVIPTAERVVKHLHAASVLNASRVMASSPQTAAQSTHASVEALRNYARLVGTPEAQKVAEALEADVRQMAAAPAAAKASVAAAYRTSRSSKDFDKKK